MRAPVLRLPRHLRGATTRMTGEHAAEVIVDGRLAARIYWHPTGAIEQLTPFDRDGRVHGTERREYADGRTRYLARWWHGRQVGWQQQWSPRGVLLVRTRFVRGSGLDAWFDRGLAETREFVDGARHGFERWWAGRGRLWSEAHFRHGLDHGVRRRWAHDGRLERGYPEFWLDGRRVSRRRYERACATDATLPQVDPRDDRPTRRAPRVIEP